MSEGQKRSARRPDLHADTARLQVLDHLKAVREEVGHVPGDVMRDAAKTLDVTPDYLGNLLRNYLRGGEVRRRRDNAHKVVLENEHQAKVWFFVHKGDATRALESLKQRHLVPVAMSVRTFQRRVKEWDPALVACAKGGYRAMVKYQFFNLEHIPFKGYAYGVDHTFLPLQALPGRGSQPVWVWCTTVVDLYSRVALAYKVHAETPNAEAALDTIVEAIRGWYTPEGEHIGGKPMFLRSDRGADFLSNVVSRNLIDLEVDRQFTAPYSSHQNGVVERLNGTLDRDMAPGLPGFHPGGAEEYTRRVLKTPVDPKSLLTLETLDRRIGEWLGNYNNRPHRSLAGLTPLEAWSQNPHNVEAGDPVAIRNAMSVRETRKLWHYGIDIRKARYTHPTLARLRSAGVKNVEIRYHDHDFDHIEVFVDGEWQCTATRAQVASETQKMGVLSVRERQRREAERLIRDAQYERVINEHERLRAEGVDESEWPELPDIAEPLAAPDPDDETTGDVFERAVNAALDLQPDDEDNDTSDVPFFGNPLSERHAG